MELKSVDHEEAQLFHSDTQSTKYSIQFSHYKIYRGDGFIWRVPGDTSFGGSNKKSGFQLNLGVLP